MERPRGSVEAERAREAVVLRIITRLNVGGPAIQTALLTHGLAERGFRTVLVTGRLGPHEGDMSDVVRAKGIEPRIVPEIGREPSLLADLVALRKIHALVRSLRPEIIHTHTTKAGTIGRLAALLAGRRPILVHTFHGLTFSGYFHPAHSRLVLWFERLLGRFTDRVVAVSEIQRRDLCDVYRVVPRERCSVVPLGFDLDAFLRVGASHGALREDVGGAERRALVGIVGRLVPIKNHELFLEVAQRVLARDRNVDFVIVGDGELRQALERSARERGIAPHVRFVGWRRDMDAVYADLDLVLLTSKSEGTPVALIEAMASRRAVVATAVGGVPDVVEHGVTGLLAPANDAETLARHVLDLLQDPARCARMGQEGRLRARERYSAERLLDDVETLYRALLARRGRR